MGAAAGAFWPRTLAQARTRAPNETINLAVVGLRWKGHEHVEHFGKLPNVRIAAVCDVDQDLLAKETDYFVARGERIKTYIDYRDVLDDAEIDVVVIATPNHWHALMTVWACQAGKDVYVEKPVSHNLWEGRQMIRAARRYGTIVQGGIQNRTNAGMDEALEYLHSGQLGGIRWVHGLWYKYRESIGKVVGPQAVPRSIDYDLHCGPAPLLPLTRRNLHYDWHWRWTTGDGDLANIGTHIFDDMRRVIGDRRQPDRLMSMGGRFLFNDDGETPNTQLAVFDYDGVPLIQEIRNLPRRSGTEQMDAYLGTRFGTIAHCEGGYMRFGWGGGTAYSPDGKTIARFEGDGGEGHAANFIAAVRARDPRILNGQMEEAVVTSELLQLANLSYRTGVPATRTAIEDACSWHQGVAGAVASLYEHLGYHPIDLAADPMIKGPWVRHERTGQSDSSVPESDEACSHELWEAVRRPHYREPYVLREVPS